MSALQTLHQTVALGGVILIAVIAIVLVSYVIVRHNVAIAENNIRMLTVCLVVPTAVLVAFIPENSLADRSAVYGLIGTIAGYILGRGGKEEKAGS